MTTQAMIKAANPEEEVLAVISEMRRANLTATQLKYVEKQRNFVFRSFRMIVNDKVGLSDKQILQLNDQNIEALLKILVKRANWKLLYNYPLHVFPITLVFIAIANGCWAPNFTLARAARKLGRAGDRPITAADIKENIENWKLDRISRVTLEKRPYEEEQKLLESVKEENP